MTAVIRDTSVAKDVEALREFVRSNALVGEDYTLELLGAIKRLEALATSTAQRSGVGSFIHIVKQRIKTDTHCGRPIAHVNFTEAKADLDLSNPNLCKRCVQLYQSRKAKAE